MYIQLLLKNYDHILVCHSVLVPDVSSQAGQADGFLSVEAVARHTAEGAKVSEPNAPTSTISTRIKTSTTGAKRNESSNPTAASTVTLHSLYNMTQIEVITTQKYHGNNYEKDFTGW